MRRRKHRKPLISLLVPFRAKRGSDRERLWLWLKEYWENELPEAEIVMGEDRGSRHGDRPFSKTAAFNDAFRKSKGDILVLLDADCYITGERIRECARRIRESLRHGHKMWYVPYRQFYRLNEWATATIITSDPWNPIRFDCPPDEDYLDMRNYDSSQPVAEYGKRYGALITIIPREAVYAVNGWDERFRGWGGEDVCFLRALDTLYGKHKNHPGCVYHLCHEIIGSTYETRKWHEEDKAQSNNSHSLKYQRANGNPEEMKRIVSGNLPWWHQKLRRFLRRIFGGRN